MQGFNSAREPPASSVGMHRYALLYCIFTFMGLSHAGHAITSLLAASSNIIIIQGRLRRSEHRRNRLEILTACRIITPTKPMLLLNNTCALLPSFPPFPMSEKLKAKIVMDWRLSKHKISNFQKSNHNCHHHSLTREKVVKHNVSVQDQIRPSS